MTLPTFIPLAEAARKYGYDVAELQELAESGKIEAVQLPDGDVIVSEDSVKEKVRKEDLPEYQEHAHLAGTPIWLSEAERKYGIDNSTLYRWMKAGIITFMYKDGYRTYVDEADVAYCAEIHRKYGKQGRKLFNPDGTPYRAKTGPLAERSTPEPKAV